MTTLLVEEPQADQSPLEPLAVSTTTDHEPPPPLPPLLLEGPPSCCCWSSPLETTVRMTAGAFVAYCLALGGGGGESTLLRSVMIPWSMQWMVGLLGPLMVLRLPPLAGCVIGSISVLYTCLLLALVSTTVLLAAATVSDAWFVALMALFVLWVSGLRYGPAGRATNLLTSLLGAFWGTVGLGLHRVVRDGVFIRISHELLEQIVLGELPLPTVHRTELLELVTPARVAELVYQLGTITEQSVVIQANGALDQLALYGAVIVAALKALQDLYSEECLSITVPVGTFEGQEADICLEDTTGDLTIGLAGGDFWIGKFWNSGVMNPLAVFPNLIVTISWVLICGYVSALLPLPRIRTVRQDLTRVLLPQVLQDAAWYLSLNSDSSNTAKRTNGSTTTEDNINSPADSNTNTPKEEESALTVNQQTQIDDNKRIVRKRLMKAVQILKEGKLALVTVFEPRLWDNCGTAPRNTFLPLQELASKVEQMALKALAVQSVDPVQSQQVLQDTIVELQRAAKALEDPATETFAIHANKTAAPETDSAPVGDPFELARLTMDISTATHDWLESMYPAAEGATRSPPWNDGTNDGAKHVAMTGAAWVLPGLLVPARLLQILLYPIQLCRNGLDSGSTEKTLQCIKFTIGFTALVSLSVFVEGYREFTVTNTQSSGEGSDLSLVRGNPPSSFSNWDLLAYLFATMPTTEGTVKKSILRICGTCVGALSAWGLLHTTGDNAIGSVAWLTVTTALGVYLSVDKRGAAARLGSSKDFGYGGFYLVLVQTVIVMEAKVGVLGDIDELVANRLVSNIFGILMAVCLSLVPPRVMGSSPHYTKKLLHEASSGLEEAARRLVYGGRYRAAEDMFVVKTNFHKTSSELRSEASYLMEDAKRMNRLPFLHVDSELEDELNSIAITCSAITAIMSQSEKLLKSWEQPEGSEPRLLEPDLMEAMKSISQGKAYADLDIDPRLGNSNDEENLVASFLVLQSRLGDHKVALEK